MEIRFNEDRQEWELFDSYCPTVDGVRQPLYSADSLEAAVSYALEEEGWL